MMYSEFLELSGQQVTYKQYSEIIEPMYMAVENMSKQDFVKFIAPSCKALVKEAKLEERKNQKTVFVSDGTTTPNGCYLIGWYYKLVSMDVSIRTGKVTYTIREMDEEEEREQRKHWDMYLSYDADIRSDNPMVIIREVS